MIWDVFVGIGEGMEIWELHYLISPMPIFQSQGFT
jgi:hypothetical protein